MARLCSNALFLARVKGIWAGYRYLKTVGVKAMKAWLDELAELIKLIRSRL